MTKWLVKNGFVVFPEWGISKVDILIENGVVTTISDRIEPYANVNIYDAVGLYVFPGFMDPHVHLGNYNDFLNDLKTETVAAAAGGVTHLMTFVKVLRHTNEMVSYKKIFNSIVEQINTFSTVDVGMHFAISTREHIAEMKDYLEMGVASFKFYMGYRGSVQAMERGSVGITDGQIFLGYKEIGKLKAPALAMTHCENEEISQALEAEMGEEAYSSFIKWANTRPNVSEAEAISRALILAKEARCPIYIVHCTSKEGLEKIRQMRKECDTPIYTEVCVHHLTLNAEKAEKDLDWGIAKVTPPLRDKASIEALWDGIRKGDIDCVGTDHCASTLEKNRDLKTAVPAFIGLEIYPALMLTEATKRGIPLQHIARVCIYNPAKIFGLTPRKGTLRPGADGDLAIFNLNVETVFDSKKGHSMTKFSPYDGWKLTAQVEATMLRGEFIYRRGEPVVMGKGRALLKREQALDT